MLKTPSSVHTDPSRDVAAHALFQILSESGEEKVLHVKGWSMGGTLGPASDVVVRPLKTPPRLGDVVVVKGKSNFFVHRMIGKRRGQPSLYITRGDNCTKADPPVSLDRIAGSAVGIKKQSEIWIPWHWKRPLSILVALVSRYHPLSWEPYHRLFRRLDYYYLRIHAKWDDRLQRSRSK